jgi:uncharacterized protein YkwD
LLAVTRARLLAPVLAVLAVVALATGCTPLTGNEQYLLVSTNALRARHGLRPVYEYEPLTAKARSWAATLATQGRLAHQNLHRLGVSWTVAAENVGRSSSIQDIAARLKASPSHRANMLRAGYQLTGVGTARGRDGAVYAVQIFLRP